MQQGLVNVYENEVLQLTLNCDRFLCDMKGLEKEEWATWRRKKRRVKKWDLERKIPSTGQSSAALFTKFKKHEANPVTSESMKKISIYKNGSLRFVKPKISLKDHKSS